MTLLKHDITLVYKRETVTPISIGTANIFLSEESRIHDSCVTRRDIIPVYKREMIKRARALQRYPMVDYARTHGDIFSRDVGIIPKGFTANEYLFRRPLDITEQSGNTLTDYQVKITLNSSNFDFSHLYRSDGKDIAVGDGEGNLYPIYIEEMDLDNQKATIWVKVPEIPANQTITLYLYYGNSEAPNLSDPYSTFVFFDDFTALDEEIWEVNSSNYTVSMGNLRLNSGGISLKNPLAEGYEWRKIVEVKLQYVDVADAYSGAVVIASSPHVQADNAGSDALIMAFRQKNQTKLYWWVADGSDASYNIKDAEEVQDTENGQWYVIGLVYDHTNAHIYVNGTKVKGNVGHVFQKDLRYITLGYYTGYDVNIQDTIYDWVRVRRTILPDAEPSVSVGSEEIW